MKASGAKNLDLWPEFDFEQVILAGTASRIPIVIPLHTWTKDENRRARDTRISHFYHDVVPMKGK